MRLLSFSCSCELPWILSEEAYSLYSRHEHMPCSKSASKAGGDSDSPISPLAKPARPLPKCYIVISKWGMPSMEPCLQTRQCASWQCQLRYRGLLSAQLPKGALTGILNRGTGFYSRACYPLPALQPFSHVHPPSTWHPGSKASRVVKHWWDYIIKIKEKQHPVPLF